MERWEFDRSESPRGWRWLRIDIETLYVRRCSDRYFETLRACVEDAVVHGYVVPLKERGQGPALKPDSDLQQGENRGQTPTVKTGA